MKLDKKKLDTYKYKLNKVFWFLLGYMHKQVAAYHGFSETNDIYQHLHQISSDKQI
jgi:hypothetical protein